MKYYTVYNYLLSRKNQNYQNLYIKLQSCYIKMKTSQNFAQLILMLGFGIQVSTVQKFPSTVWMYQDNGIQSLTQIGKLAIKRIRQSNQNWEVKFVSDKTLNQYLDATQLGQLGKIETFQGVKISPHSKSFFVRLMLLRKYGGVWIDVNTLLLQNLDWLNQLQYNKEVMNKLSSPPQVFLFYVSYDPALGRLNVIKQKGITFYPTIEIQLMLMAAVKDSVYIKDLYNQLKQIHQKGKDYYEKVKIQLFLFRDLKDSQTLPLANHIIQHRQYRRFESNLKKNIQSSVDQLYKVWAINRMKGPFTYFNQRNCQILFKDVTHWTYQPKYLVILQYCMRDHKLSKFLTNGSYQKDMLMRQQSQSFLYDLGQYYLPSSYSCLYKSYIDENSIVNQHLIQSIKNQKQLQAQFLKVTKNSQLPWICKQTTIYNLYDHYKDIWEFLWIPLYLVVFLEFSIEITLCLKRYSIILREENISKPKKQHLKEKLYLLGLLAFVAFLQYQFLYEQVFMWYYQYPYYLLILATNIAVMCLVLSYFNIVQRYCCGFIINIDVFIGLLIFSLLLQLSLIQNLSVWNFDGFLFHFQKLRRMNASNNQKFFRGFLKILLMYLIAKIYYCIKKYHNKNHVEIEAKFKICFNRVKQFIKEKYKKLQSQSIEKVRIDQMSQEETRTFAEAQVCAKN